MKALIAQHANGYSAITNKDSYHNYLASKRGQYVDIDPSHLFDNQYNTVDGVRIFDTHIQLIQDDVRPLYMPNSSKPVFFVKHPNGKDGVWPISVDGDHKKDGFYSFTGYPELGYYRISRCSSIEFVLVDGVPYITNGIGYYPTTSGPYKLTANELKILNKCVKMVLQYYTTK